MASPLLGEIAPSSTNFVSSSSCSSVAFIVIILAAAYLFYCNNWRRRTPRNRVMIRSTKQNHNSTSPPSSSSSSSAADMLDIPSPWKLPLIGNLHQLSPLLHRSLHALSLRQGPLMLLHFGTVPTLVVSSSELAEEVLRSQDRAFASRSPSSVMKKLTYGSRDSALIPYGDYWRAARRITVVHLLGLKQVQLFRPGREEEVAAKIARVRAMVAGGGGLVDLSSIIARLTDNVIMRAALGRKYLEEEDHASYGNEFRRIFLEFSTLIAKVPIGDYVPCFSWLDELSGLNSKVVKHVERLDAFLEKLIEDRLQSPRRNGNNFLDVLLSLPDDEAEAAIGASPSGRDSVKAILLVMFIAGTKTMTTAMEWTMAEMVSNQEVLKRAQEEVRRVVAFRYMKKEQGVEEEIVVEEDDLGEMKYLKAAIMESMRLHPPLPLLLPHASTVDTTLQGYHIPAGTKVMINTWTIGRDPESWGADAEEFRPERFMEKGNSHLDYHSVNGSCGGQDFRYIPFGSGRRSCPGIQFATPVVELMLANLLYHFDWEFAGEGIIDKEEKPGLGVGMKSKLILSLLIN